MPNIDFVLPHWLYWIGLLLFPIIGLAATNRQKIRKPDTGVALPVAYLFWLTAGFTGLHRFYVKSRWGYVFIPLLAGIIYANFQVKEARELVSSARQQLRTATYERDRASDNARQGTGADQRLQAAEAKVATLTTGMASAQKSQDNWVLLSGSIGGVVLVLLLIDAVLLPRLVKTCRAEEDRNPPQRFKPVELPPDLHAQGQGEAPTLAVKAGPAVWLDKITNFAGLFVSYWTLLSIFIYYYEVIVRFVFNSPTNWAHESMFLMYGMQYLICGAYALKADAHVRVDVFYVKFSARGKALADVVTSFFFFIFAGTLLVTGVTYAQTAVQLGEVSFTEWGIQYWPIKIAIPVGAALILLQGLSHFIKDIQILVSGKA